jgi:hypothetical protein
MILLREPPPGAPRPVQVTPSGDVITVTVPESLAKDKGLI